MLGWQLHRLTSFYDPGKRRRLNPWLTSDILVVCAAEPSIEGTYRHYRSQFNPPSGGLRPEYVVRNESDEIHSIFAFDYIGLAGYEDEWVLTTDSETVSPVVVAHAPLSEDDDYPWLPTIWLDTSGENLNMTVTRIV